MFESLSLFKFYLAMLLLLALFFLLLKLLQLLFLLGLFLQLGGTFGWGLCELPLLKELHHWVERMQTITPILPILGFLTPPPLPTHPSLDNSRRQFSSSVNLMGTQACSTTRMFHHLRPAYL